MLLVNACNSLIINTICAYFILHMGVRLMIKAIIISY